MKKLIPSKNAPDQDKVMTPLPLCKAIVKHFIPDKVMVLEPSKGTGNFIYAMAGKPIVYNWCEVDEGRDFF